MSPPVPKDGQLLYKGPDDHNDPRSRQRTLTTTVFTCEERDAKLKDGWRETKEFPQILFRGKVTPDGIPTIEQRTVHDEAERTRALAEGWTQDQRTAGENAQLEKLAYQEQQHRNHQAANRRQAELLEQVLTKLLSQAQESAVPPSVGPVTLGAPAPAIALSGPETKEAKAERRQAFVGPRFKQKGLNVNRWAKAGEFDPNTGYRYLAGENISTEQRLKLAAGLGVDVLELPE